MLIHSLEQVNNAKDQERNGAAHSNYIVTVSINSSRRSNLKEELAKLTSP